MKVKFKNNKNVTTVVFGDGATEQGTFHESLNFASLHNLPVLFVCEDNGLAVHSSLKDRHSYNHEIFATPAFNDTCKKKLHNLRKEKYHK